MNGIIAAAIEKAGALIDCFETTTTESNAFRLIAKTKKLIFSS